METVFKIFEPIWRYRGFILGSVKREFQNKYRNSLLGAAWTVLNPLAMIFVYTVIFSQVMKAKLPGVSNTFSYSIYLCAGLLTWGLFAEIVNRAQNTFIEHANLLKKLNFPSLCLPVTLVATSLLNFSIVFGLFTGFLIVSGNFPGMVYFALLPVLLILVAFAAGLGVALGVLNVFFRDIGHLFGIFIQFWFWLTPIVYPLTILPESIRPYIALNPMAVLIEACHQVLVLGVQPDWASLWPVTMWAVLFCAWAMRLFRKHAGEMVDEL